ncbi:MAG: fibronectin type III domain-containing protein, partial [Candidatus Colwellbacteria bacterium]|nr:fibronectin type III domain-containing protein [Candidatus Colwellbacteria bacterium]
GDGASLNLSGYAINSSSVQLNWAEVDGASEYRVHESGQFLGYTFGTEFTDTGLAPSATYTYLVAAEFQIRNPNFEIRNNIKFSKSQIAIDYF